VAWVEYETGNNTKRPQNCGTGYCSCIECVMEPATQPAPVQEPVAHRDGYWCVDLTCKKCYSADFRFKHTTPPAQPAPVQEPVITVQIWRDENGDQNAEFRGWHTLPDGQHTFYTPPQRT
jgi:hypothetical protein